MIFNELESYGRSPAMAALEDMRELERIRNEDPEAYAKALASVMEAIMDEES